MMLRGVIPVLVMPFTESEEVDHDSLSRQVDFLIGSGLDACAFGFGSEIQRLTERELDAAVSAIVTEAAGRLSVIANVAAASVVAAVERTKIAASLGADAVMMPPPYPGNLAEHDVFEFFHQVAEQTVLPIVVQDAPAVTGINLSPGLLARLGLEIERVAALKLEPLPSPAKVEEVAALVGGCVTLLGGNGGVDFYQELERGIDGTMPGPAFPEVFQRIYESHRNGQFAEARSYFTRVLPLLTASVRTGDGFLYVQKEILRRRGVIASARLRSPSEIPSQSFVEELEILIEDAELDLPSRIVAA